MVAHENVPRRFARYALTAGYNGVINARQFGLPELAFPTDFRAPDETYTDELSLEVGGERFELHHAKGETDDHTWTWVPGRRILCCGDLFIWATPNAGNPQKAQRHPREWAQALRQMAELDAEMMLPGHGPPLVGADRVQAALTDTAALLESLVEQTLALMNEGAPLDHGRALGAGARRSCSPSPTCGRSTTSRSSSSATSGASTAAGTTAIPPISSPPRREHLAAELARAGRRRRPARRARPRARARKAI